MTEAMTLIDTYQELVKICTLHTLVGFIRFENNEDVMCFGQQIHLEPPEPPL